MHIHIHFLFGNAPSPRLCMKFSLLHYPGSQCCNRSSFLLSKYNDDFSVLAFLGAIFFAILCTTTHFPNSKCCVAPSRLIVAMSLVYASCISLSDLWEPPIIPGKALFAATCRRIFDQTDFFCNFVSSRRLT